jgi:hypothetical protein
MTEVVEFLSVELFYQFGGQPSFAKNVGGE